jgi:acetylornithine deacetylase/succinyl-diaminopimelate desuccinylase-like protein
MNLSKNELLAFARAERERFERALRQFVEIPTVSSEPDRQGDIRRCADLAAQTIREFGGEPRILETAGNPIVHGRFDSDHGGPTVTIYNHLDVQPASRETEPWDSDPFIFTKNGDRYFGRGTTDD